MVDDLIHAALELLIAQTLAVRWRPADHPRTRRQNEANNSEHLHAQITDKVADLTSLGEARIATAPAQARLLRL